MLGTLKVPDVMHDIARITVTENRVLACVHKMFNMAEVWGIALMILIHAAMPRSIGRMAKRDLSPTVNSPNSISISTLQTRRD